MRSRCLASRRSRTAAHTVNSQHCRRASSRPSSARRISWTPNGGARHENGLSRKLCPHPTSLASSTLAHSETWIFWVTPKPVTATVTVLPSIRSVLGAIVTLDPPRPQRGDCRRPARPQRPDHTGVVRPGEDELVAPGLAGAVRPRRACQGRTAAVRAEVPDEIAAHRVVRPINTHKRSTRKAFQPNTKGRSTGLDLVRDGSLQGRLGAERLVRAESGLDRDRRRTARRRLHERRRGRSTAGPGGGRDHQAGENRIPVRGQAIADHATGAGFVRTCRDTAVQSGRPTAVPTPQRYHPTVLRPRGPDCRFGRLWLDPSDAAAN